MRRNYGACKNPNLFAPHLQIYSEPTSEIFTGHSSGFYLNVVKISTLNLRTKKFIEKMQRCHVFKSETLESKALIPNFMQPTHKIEENIDQRLRNQPLLGGNLLYIT